MKNINCQISSANGRSTKKNSAGLSLLRPRLFTVVNDTYKYFNEIFQNILKPISRSISFSIDRLRTKKFRSSNVRFGQFPYKGKHAFTFILSNMLPRPFYRPNFSTYKFDS